jgi:cell division protein FtsZ
VLKGSDMVFVTSGMGGGTGTGAAAHRSADCQGSRRADHWCGHPPFTFEGSRRRAVRGGGHLQAERTCDTLIVIPNDRLLQMVDKRASLQDAFRLADDVLRQGIQGISELITVPGLINLDFADVRAIMSEGGAALMAVGRHRAKNGRAKRPKWRFPASCWTSPSTAHAASCSMSPAAQPDPVRGQPGGRDHQRNRSPDVNLIFGAVIDQNMKRRSAHHCYCDGL